MSIFSSSGEPYFPHHIIKERFIPANELMPLHNYTVVFGMALGVLEYLQKMYPSVSTKLERVLSWDVSPVTMDLVMQAMQKGHKKFKLICSPSRDTVEKILKINVTLTIVFLKNLYGHLCDSGTFGSYDVDEVIALLARNKKICKQIHDMCLPFWVESNKDIRSATVQCRKCIIQNNNSGMRQKKYEIFQATQKVILGLPLSPTQIDGLSSLMFKLIVTNT